MSHKTAKTVTNKFLSTTKSDREGRRTVGSGRVATIIEKFIIHDNRMLTKCAFYCLTGFGLYSAILEKSGVAVFLFKNVKKWLMVKVLKFIDE